MENVLAKTILLAFALFCAAGIAAYRAELVVERFAAAHAILEPIARVGQ